MARSAVFVDAGYLFKAGGALVARPDCRREELVLDGAVAIAALSETATRITQRELLRIYWYDAAATAGPRADHRAIAELPNVKLRLGHLNSAGQQKGVDPLIITDMIALARNRACDDMILLSGDADLVVGVLQAQEHGVRVHLLGVSPTRANQAVTLRQEADTHHEWAADVVGQFLRSATPSEMAVRGFRRTSPTAGSDPGVTVSTALIAPATHAAVQGGAEPLHTQGVGQAPVPPSSGISAKVPGVIAMTGISDAQLRVVAEAVDRDLSPEDRRLIAAEPRVGTIPGQIDRRLLGSAKAMLNTMLQESEKRVLRRLLHEVCVQNTKVDV